MQSKFFEKPYSALNVSLLAILLALLSVGCTSTQELKSIDFVRSAGKSAVPIKLFIDDNEKSSEYAYQYDRKIRQRFLSSGLFSSVYDVAPDWPYAVYVNFKREIDGALGGAASLVSAASLFIIPSKENVIYTLEVLVVSGGQQKEYRYSDRRTETTSLVNLVSEKDPYDPLNNLLNYFFTDLQADSILPKSE